MSGILILDYGSQYTQLIARRVREAHVYCEIHPPGRDLAFIRRFQPQVESMEGAAFMYACATADVPFAHVRAVSNFVEPRNRAAWKIQEAIAALDRTARDILSGL